ncbi:MAG TPA: hypothetical protein V6D20_13415 [Candidatus Obscuribacterales bacterium]
MKTTSITLELGNCLDVLKGHESNSIDSLITDPPYGLGEEPDPLELFQGWVQEGAHEGKSSGGFMGKTWDATVPGPGIWREVLRVLKPGGRGGVFAGTRTLHMMMASLRMAGFEIVDVLAWTYGSGFPKSHNVHKALLKKVKDRYGATRCKCSEESAPFDPEQGLDLQQESERYLILDDYAAHDLVTRVCSWCAQPDQGFIDSVDGLGTALKPAWEPIIEVRKPLEPTLVDIPALLQSYGFSAEEITSITSGNPL